MALDIRISEVTACIDAHRDRVAFPAKVERLYQSSIRSYRAKALRSGVVPVLIIYNSFLLIDAVLVPGTFWIAAVIHCTVSIWIAVVGELLRTEPSAFVRETLAVSVPLLISGQILLIFTLNSGSPAEHYQYLAVCVLIYMNVNMRPAIDHAIAGSLIIGLAYASALAYVGEITPAVVVGSALMSSAIYLTLLANRRMERDVRHAFLHRLREKLRRQEAEADASRDALTGLGNRRHVDRVATEFWDRKKGSAGRAAVIMLDVDHFKAFNDHCGHPAGDECLRRISQVAMAVKSS